MEKFLKGALGAIPRSLSCTAVHSKRRQPPKIN